MDMDRPARLPLKSSRPDVAKFGFEQTEFEVPSIKEN